STYRLRRLLLGLLTLLLGTVVVCKRIRHMPGNPLLADGRLAHEPLSGQSSVSAQRTSAVLDFAQLVDRLVEAREAAAPQLVRTAVQHAEFGRISLQFSSLPDHLRVTMASADPDFVPAAQAAAALAAAPAGQDTEAVRAGPQPQQHAMSGAATQGMMSGDTSARSGDAGRHGAGEDNPAPRNAGRRREQSEGDSARQPLGRKGIYA
ncbi:MAG: hypothetical protein N2423_08435, partial [Novosphingobium sp.]|nr:hypothetical protein [Novosphingobium sp.]